MRSILTITTAPSVTKLVTLDRVKAEFSITTSANDAILNSKIDEATSDIEMHLRRDLSRATVSQTFWSDGDHCANCLSLERYPAPSITSVTVDDVEVDASEYRLDGDAGLLYRLDSSGYPCVWIWCKSIVVIYAGGYLLPGETGRNLPPVLEGAALDLVQSYWSARGRDPLVRSEDVPGLGSVEYWVGAVGEAGELPPSVVSKISHFRRPYA